MRNQKKLQKEVYEQMADRMTSPPEVVDEIVSKQLKWKDFSKKRIVEGVGNEVYRITKDDTNVILRIHHGIHPGFEHERWAIEQATRESVPTPKVIAVGEYMIGMKTFSFLLQTYLPGYSLSTLLDEGMSSGEIKHYAYLSGEMLARIHSVTTSGYGHFTTKSGVGPYATLVEEMEQHTDYKTLLQAITDTPLTMSELDSIIQLIDEIENSEDPHLVHVDYAPKHIFVEGREIVGIIDWEICMSGITATDFNRWRSQDNRIPMLDLIPGYEAIRPLPPSFWETLHVVQMHSALRTLLYHWNVTKSTRDVQKAAEEAKKLFLTGEPIFI